MIVVCPSCAAQYGVDREAFGLSARVVRCSACDHEWEALPGDYDGVAALDPVAEFGENRIEEDAVAGLFDGPPWPEGTPAAAVADGELSVQTEATQGAPPDEAGDWNDATAPRAADLRSDPLQSDASGDHLGDADAAVSQEPVVFSEPDDETSPASAAADATEDGPAPADADEKMPVRRRRGLIMTVGAVAALALVPLVLIGAEGAITRAFPAAGAVYSLFGLAPARPGVGLDIRDVSSSRESSGSEDVLIVAGTVTNVASGPRELPPLRVALFDADRSEIQAVVVPPIKATLGEGESVPFVARIPNPAITARRAVVSFQAAPAGHG